MDTVFMPDTITVNGAKYVRVQVPERLLAGPSLAEISAWIEADGRFGLFKSGAEDFHAAIGLVRAAIYDWCRHMSLPLPPRENI